MPTDRPKVQGYVSQAIYDKLVEFKDTYCLKSMSEAVTLTLQEFFAIKTVNLEVNQSELLNRVEHVEKQVLALSQTVAALSVSKSQNELLNKSELLSIEGNTTVDKSDSKTG